MKWTACLAVLGTLGGAAGHAQQQQEPPASVLVRPLASLIIPGMGQLMAHQDRGAVYIAAEVYLLSRYLQLDHEATVEARRFQSLAFDVARQSFVPLRRDTIFEYYEQMERFAESGRYDADTGPAFVPESDPATYNGSVWLLARRTFWADPNIPPDPTSPQYWKALQFYQARAVGPNFLWSWRNHSLEHEVFRDYIRRSDNAFRRAQNQVGLVLANHVLSAVDALISARMSAAAGRAAEMRTSVGLSGRSEVRFSIAF
ncbi:MAG: hypothetical protein DMD38_12215 [Gemmatimonadetes bacterium]|nr:MAG: hypothetical protein AUI86_09375 [Gemmatimonadetes bacterium 13_1_40CM_3_66_12]PYP95568.1 MAG: hypothetical protein DMD38_12215 [Gemmatimonadota bacterium]